MKKKKTTLGIVSSVLFFIPAVSQAAILKTIIPASCQIGPCHIGDVPTVLSNLVWDLGFLSIPIAVVAYSYGGILLILSPADPGKMKEGVTVIKNASWGVVLVFTAYIIIQLIISTLGLSGGDFVATL
jgi:hypothetical protein